MHWRLASALLLVAYGAILVKVMVLKDVPLIKVGTIMLNFGGINAGHGPNFLPFATIGPYLLGHKGLIIAGINLVGNIILLVPLGFLMPLVYRDITWKISLALAVLSGLAIEILQTVLRVGIFDIDDVILNALGFMMGYAACAVLTRWVRSKNYQHMVIAALAAVAAAAAAYAFVVYPISHQPVGPNMRAGGIQQGQDLCGGTGGNGRIVSTGANSFTMERNDGSSQTVNLTHQAKISTAAGTGSISDLKMGDRVTLVGGPNPDGSFTAEAVFVCAAVEKR